MPRKRKSRPRPSANARREFKLKSDRSIRLFQLIQQEGPISIPALRRRWQEESGEKVAEKTVQRDIHYLRDRRNAPLEYDGSRKGWFLTDGKFRLESFQLTEGELLALVVAERAVASIRSAPLGRKVAAIFQRLCAGLESEVSVDPDALRATMAFSAGHAAPVDEGLIETLNKAIVQRRMIEMEYTTAGGEKTRRRTVHPYHLRCHQGDWYLVGRYHGTANVPLLALHRMRDVELTRRPFERDFDPDAYFKDTFGFEVSGRTHTVRIAFSPKAAFYIRERQLHPEERRQDGPDGGLTVSFPVQSLEEIRRWVMGWGAEARVLAPKALADAVRREAEGIIRRSECA